MKVFLCYAREDLKAAQKLYKRLVGENITVWFDQEDLLPGQVWEDIIRQEIEDCSYFLALLSSHSVSKRGFVQKELKYALDIQEELPPKEIFIIPVRLEECISSDGRLPQIHCVDIFPSFDEGIQKILKTLQVSKKEIKIKDEESIIEENFVGAIHIYCQKCQKNFYVAYNINDLKRKKKKTECQFCSNEILIAF